MVVIAIPIVPYWMKIASNNSFSFMNLMEITEIRIEISKLSFLFLFPIGVFSRIFAIITMLSISRRTFEKKNSEEL